MPQEARCFLIKKGGHSIVCRLDLSGLPRILKLLSGRETTVRAVDKLRSQLGDEPKNWLKAFLTGSAGDKARAESNTTDEKVSLDLNVETDPPRKSASSAGGSTMIDQCTLNTDGLASPLLEFVDCQIGSYVAGAYAALFGPFGWMGPILTAMLTIYVAVFGFQLVTGRTGLSLTSILPRMILVALVITFATRWGT